MSGPIQPAPVPEPVRRTLYVCCPKVGQPEDFTSYSPHVIGIWTHWMSGTTHPCLAAPLACPGCSEGAPRRWKGYLYGWSWTHARTALLELPADTVRCHVQLRDPAVNLRGARIRATRKGPHPNSEVTCLIRLDACRVEDGIQEPDVIGHLMRRWGLGSYDQPPAQLPEGGEQ